MVRAVLPRWLRFGPLCLAPPSSSAGPIDLGGAQFSASGLVLLLLLLIPFVLGLAVGLLYVAQRRRLRTIARLESENRALQARLSEPRPEVPPPSPEQDPKECQRALDAERQRLMQDMHDGLGSSLLSTMVAVEQGSMSRLEVVDMLRECVDDLRLVIDSLEPLEHDLMALLATMRYRLGKRLHASGLVLDWDVQDLPTLKWLEPPDALHVLRLLQEALNNVLKHARATRARFVTRSFRHYVEIRVEDDGQGFDLATIQCGRGLKGQLRRAQALGGSLTIDSAPGQGTRVCLRLPLTRKDSPSPG